MASRRRRRVSYRLDDYDDDEENESGTDSEDDGSSSSDTDTEPDTEPEAVVNLLPQGFGQARDSAIEVEEESEDEEEDEEEEGRGGGGKESEGRVENGVEKGKENVRIEVGDNFVLPTCPVCMEAWTSEGPHRVWYRHFFLN